MPDDELKSIVREMMDAGKSDDEIGKFIGRYDEAAANVDKEQNRSRIVGDVYKGPDTFWGGVANSLNPFKAFSKDGGEAVRAAGSGLMGYAQGAVNDIPSSIVGGVKNLAGFTTDVLSDPVGMASKTVGAITDPGTYRGLGMGAQSVGNSILSAGSNPEEFGRTMGQITGQPLTTAGLMEGAPYILPPVTRAVGRGMEITGDLMHRKAPISGSIPRVVEPRVARDLERFVGGKIAAGGRALQETPYRSPLVEGTISGETPPLLRGPAGYAEGEIIPPEAPRGLPPSNVRSYQGPSSFADEVLGESTPVAHEASPSTGMRSSDLQAEATTPTETVNMPHEFSPDMPVSAPAEAAPVAESASKESAPAQTPIQKLKASAKPEGAKERAPLESFKPKAEYSESDYMKLRKKYGGNAPEDRQLLDVINSELGSPVKRVIDAPTEDLQNLYDELSTYPNDPAAKEAAAYLKYTIDFKNSRVKDYPGFKGVERPTSHGPTNEYYHGVKQDMRFAGGDAQFAAKNSKARAMRAWAEKNKKK